MGPKFQIVANISSDLSKHAREGHSANEKNFVPIRFTSSEKIPKNYQLWQFRNFGEVFFLRGGVVTGCWVRTQETYSPSFFGEIFTSVVFPMTLVQW